MPVCPALRANMLTGPDHLLCTGADHTPALTPWLLCKEGVNDPYFANKETPNSERRDAGHCEVRDHKV